MALRTELERRIDKKQVEINGWRAEIRRYRELVNSAQSYIQALEDTLKLLPKDDSILTPQATLRPGTAVHKAKEAILAAGRPLHIDELLKAIGKQIDADSRGALSGSLSTYVRKGQIFTRPAPNTFGTFGLMNGTASELVNPPGPPQNFGKDPPLDGGGEDPSQAASDDDWDFPSATPPLEGIPDEDVPF